MNKEKKITLPVLVDDGFDIKLKFEDYENVLRILRDQNYNLTIPDSSQKLIHVDGLVGVDVMQFMKDVEFINYMKRLAWVFSSSIAPFENSQRYLHENQIKPVERKSVEPPEDINVQLFQLPYLLQEFRIESQKELFRSYR